LLVSSGVEKLIKVWTPFKLREERDGHSEVQQCRTPFSRADFDFFLREILNGREEFGETTNESKETLALFDFFNGADQYVDQNFDDLGDDYFNSDEDDEGGDEDEDCGHRGEDCSATDDDDNTKNPLDDDDNDDNDDDDDDESDNSNDDHNDTHGVDGSDSVEGSDGVETDNENLDHNSNDEDEMGGGGDGGHADEPTDSSEVSHLKLVCVPDNSSSDMMDETKTD